MHIVTGHRSNEKWTEEADGLVLWIYLETAWNDAQEQSGASGFLEHRFQRADYKYGLLEIWITGWWITSNGGLGDESDINCQTKETMRSRNHYPGDSLLPSTRWRARNNWRKEDRKEEEVEFTQWCWCLGGRHHGQTAPADQRWLLMDSERMISAPLWSCKQPGTAPLLPPAELASLIRMYTYTRRGREWKSERCTLI